MSFHREFRDFHVLMETFFGEDTNAPHDILGRGGERIDVGDVLLTLYKGCYETWDVVDIDRPTPGLWKATVVPAWGQRGAEIIPFPTMIRTVPVRPVLPPAGRTG